MDKYPCLVCGQLRLSGIKKGYYCALHKMGIELNSEKLPTQLNKCIAERAEQQREQEVK